MQCFVGLLWFGTGILSLEPKTLLVDASCLPLPSVGAPSIMQSGFLFLWPSCPTSWEEGGAGMLLRKQLHSSRPLLAPYPAHEFTLAFLGTVSSWWHWDVCMACTISLFCFLVAFLFPASHCCCTYASPSLYPCPVCTRAQFVPVPSLFLCPFCTCASPSLYPCPVCTCASPSVGLDLCPFLCPPLPLSPGMPSWHIPTVRDALIQTPFPKMSSLRFRLVPSEGQR